MRTGLPLPPAPRRSAPLKPNPGRERPGTGPGGQPVTWPPGRVHLQEQAAHHDSEGPSVPAPGPLAPHCHPTPSILSKARTCARQKHVPCGQERSPGSKVGWGSVQGWTEPVPGGSRQPLLLPKAPSSRQALMPPAACRALALGAQTEQNSIIGPLRWGSDS